ncbi:hypothetical protein SAMN02746065_107170 [Desulfocicer vacuolatum DSM 3385]|uniref:Uncharacterized protein n=1 Tax=Desulfocicer vacuolatum DSM 3385 TaxID=1121400 RepID=A0A1W2B9Y7_9BACT|nr:hypothetical protein [Desulfocicer vacuolatum]SMC69601.1 hypothetical protein SAMN02746065_107170 [Desulfocicer vacuolatum DSM 3385]
MKKNALIRVAFIGALHSFLYLWFVPFVIYPRFGDNGFKMTVAVAVLISIALLVTLFMGKSKK